MSSPKRKFPRSACDGAAPHQKRITSGHPILEINVPEQIAARVSQSTRIGMRMPFMPPIGGIFAAWGSQKERSSWVSNSNTNPDETRRRYEPVIERIRKRGYALGLGN